MAVTAILCRTGRKRRIRDLILSQMPKDFKTYTEAFVGTGDIYFALNLDPTVRAVINDLDPIIAKSHKFIKSNPSIANIAKYEMSPTQIQDYVNKPHSSPMDNFVKNLFIMCGSFGGQVRQNKEGGNTIYKYPSLKNKLEKIPETAEYMKNTTVLQKGWKSVISQYDSPSTFHYLDPPYENSEKLYKEGSMDFEDLAKYLKTIKGKFILSINDSPNIRNLFKGFKQQKISVKGGANNQEKGTIGQKIRGELLIKNF